MTDRNVSKFALYLESRVRMQTNADQYGETDHLEYGDRTCKIVNTRAFANILHQMTEQ